MGGETGDMLVVMVSALAAALAFMAFALPMLNRTEKKERYRSVIEKRRRDLFEQTKQQAASRGKDTGLSARESLALTFKVQQMFGAMGEKVRIQLLQAGIRSPTAPVKFIAARALLPLLFMGVAMLVVTGGDEELSNAKVMLVLLLALGFGYKLPAVIVKNQMQKRALEINQSFPDALDMMLICVQGGIGLEQTVARIAEEIAEHSPVLAEELGILSAEMAMLSDRRAALQDFAKRVGSGSARSFSTSLIQAEQYGTSVSQAMRVMAEESRDQRMQLAEQKAASLPPKLTVPMILFFLPVLFVVILGPAILQAMQTL